mmetsp:Transcript_3952/g.5979  ORF Transcript_3952/g.5979 Transcript_3952/m.5979 type:complete len:352 (+) Transcript_3952:1-1056(+)
MEETFKADFLVHEVSTSLRISKPAISIRFMEFPTLTVFGSDPPVFNKGKSCKFQLEKETLNKALTELPLYVMLVDAFSRNLRMLGTAAVDLSAFAGQKLPNKTDYKRNLLELYDPVRNVVAKVDMSISISKLEGSEYPKEIFENVTQHQVSKMPPNKGVDVAVETDFTDKKDYATQSVSATVQQAPSQTQTSVFGEVYQPPPMFYCSAKKKAKAPKKIITQPQPPAPAPPQEPPSFVKQLAEEIKLLREPKAPKALNQAKAASIGVEPVRSLKQTVSEYSEDFESATSSLEKSVKCFMCGEMIKPSEASNHPRVCPKMSNEGSLSNRDFNKSLGHSSITEEYESDFEESVS